MYELELSIKHAQLGVDLAGQWRRAIPSLLSEAPLSLDVDDLIAKIGRYVRRSGKQRATLLWRVAEAWMRVLQAAHKLRELARVGAGGVAEERERLTVLTQDVIELQRKVDDPRLAAKLAELFDHGSSQMRRDQVVGILSGLTLPTIYLRVPSDTLKLRRRHRSVPNTPSQEPVPVVRLICDLDGTPLVSPQLLRPGPIYTLTFRVRCSQWPANATGMNLRFLSTCPKDCYSVSDLNISRPASATEQRFEGEVTGHLRFPIAQSTARSDLVFRTQCEFQLSDGRVMEAPVVGYHEMRFRVSERSPLGLQTPYQRLDTHVTELLEGLVATHREIATEVPTLLPILEALVGVVGTFAQEGMFKKKTKVSEKEFQREVVRLLRMRFGTEVQEHGEQAGGITDVRYKGVIIELKVETTTGDRQRIAERYTSQPTQYAGSEARQVAIALILDLTKKVRPPGDIRNDILLVDVPTHGGSEAVKPYPSKAFVFVVNGNTRNPSSYS